MHRRTESVHVYSGRLGCPKPALRSIPIGSLSCFAQLVARAEFVSTGCSRLRNLYQETGPSVQISYHAGSETEAASRLCGRDFFAAVCAAFSAALACAKVLNCCQSLVAVQALSPCLMCSYIGSSVKR